MILLQVCRVMTSALQADESTRGKKRTAQPVGALRMRVVAELGTGTRTALAVFVFSLVCGTHK
jgi:hypothetical protein